MNICFSTIFVILNFAFQITESYKITLYKKSENCKILYVDFSGDSNEENIQFYSQLKNEAWNTKDVWLISILELTVSKFALQEIKKHYQNPICKTLQFHSCSFSDDSFNYHPNSIKTLSLEKDFKKPRFLSGKNQEFVPYLPNSHCNEKLADEEFYQKILPKRENQQLISISFDSCIFTGNSLEIVLKTLTTSIQSFIFDGNSICSEKISKLYQ